MTNTSKVKLRVLLAVPLPPPFAGPEVSSRIMINSFLKDEFDLDVIRTTVHNTNSQRGRVSMGSILKFFGLLIKLKWTILTRRPKCVYTILNQNVTGFLRDSGVVLVSKLFGRKVILHFRGSNFEAFYKQQNDFFKKYIVFILNRVDRIILQAYWVRDKFKQFVPDRKLTVIYNAVSAQEFADIKNGRGNSGIKVNILFLNHLSVAKGAVDLIEAARRVCRARDNARFSIAGDIINQEKNILMSEDGRRVEFTDIPGLVTGIKNDPQINGRIEFLGEVLEDEAKRKLYADADIFVLPSFSEGCPLSVLEAMAAGVPVIVTPVGALVEIIVDKENGFFVPIGDHQKLEEKLLALIDDSSLRVEMGKKNKRLMQERFDTAVILRQIANLFADV